MKNNKTIDREVKLSWAVLCIALLLFIIGFSSCSSSHGYGRETWKESENLYEKIACKIGRDSLNIRLEGGGLLKVYPTDGSIEITAEHTKETVYLDRHYGSIFVYMYLRHRHVSFEELANDVFEKAYAENVKFY